jgi:hypothetical protein
MNKSTPHISKICPCSSPVSAQSVGYPPQGTANLLSAPAPSPEQPAAALFSLPVLNHQMGYSVRDRVRLCVNLITASL